MRVAVVCVIAVILLLSSICVKIEASSIQDNENMTLTFSTYFGGSGVEWTAGGHLDSKGNLVIAGRSTSSDLPVLNAQQENFSGVADAYVAKFNTDNDLIFCTYFGGSRDDDPMAMIVDEFDNIVIGGMTESNDLPTLNALDNEYGGDGDAFVAKFSSTGELVFSTYIGGSGEEWIFGLALDPSGNYVATGDTKSDDLQTTDGAYQDTFGGFGDIFVAKLSSDGQSLEFLTYFGGDDLENSFAIAVAEDGCVAITGITQSASITTEDAYQREYGGGMYDGIVAKLSANGRSLLWSTLLGGSGLEFNSKVGFDSQGNVIVGGYTHSSDFPLVDQYQNDSGDKDAFLAKIGSNGKNLISSTYLGGDEEDRAYGLAILPQDMIAIAGPTYSDDFPTKNAYQSESNGSSDAYVTVFNKDCKSIYCSTYIGGSETDRVMSLVGGKTNELILIGFTNSNDFPTVDPFQAEWAGSDDVVVCRIQIPPPTTVPIDGDLAQYLAIALTISGIGVVLFIIAVLRRRG